MRVVECFSLGIGVWAVDSAVNFWFLWECFGEFRCFIVFEHQVQYECVCQPFWEEFCNRERES
jgi:hypothetical protein